MERYDSNFKTLRAQQVSDPRRSASIVGDRLISPTRHLGHDHMSFMIVFDMGDPALTIKMMGQPMGRFRTWDMVEDRPRMSDLNPELLHDMGLGGCLFLSVS
jgi:hypothetical protein